MRREFLDCSWTGKILPTPFAKTATLAKPFSGQELLAAGALTCGSACRDAPAENVAAAGGRCRAVAASCLLLSLLGGIPPGSDSASSAVLVSGRLLRRPTTTNFGIGLRSGGRFHFAQYEIGWWMRYILVSFAAGIAASEEQQRNPKDKPHLPTPASLPTSRKGSGVSLTAEPLVERRRTVSDRTTGPRAISPL